MIPDETQLKIAERLRSKVPMRRVAQQLGVSIGAVRRIRAKEKIELRQKGDPNPYVERRRGEAIILRKAGFTEFQIGQKMGGITKQRVSQLLRGLNVAVRCDGCREATTRPHYYHDNGNDVPRVLCPACVWESQQEKKAERVRDGTTKRFLQRHV